MKGDFSCKRDHSVSERTNASSAWLCSRLPSCCGMLTRPMDRCNLTTFLNVSIYCAFK